MEFAWNTQKNKLNDVKGKELEQERKGRISNEDIDLNKTYLNYDLIESDLNLYQRVKKRIDEVRFISRIQKNSVVMYSNVITVNKDEFKKWGIEKTKEYFECVTEYFQNEFGKENVISAKVHLDETTPHMHLHFVPVSVEGKLQARSVMTPGRINKIHSEAPKWLFKSGFEVERGKGATGKKNEKDIHKYKVSKLYETVENLEEKVKFKQKELDTIISEKEKVEQLIKSKEDIKSINLSVGRVISSKDYKMIEDTMSFLINENTRLKLENNKLNEGNFLKDKEIQNLNNFIDLNKRRYKFIEKYYDYKNHLDKEYNRKLQELEKKYEFYDARVHLLERDKNGYKIECEKKSREIERLNNLLRNKNKLKEREFEREL